MAIEKNATPIRRQYLRIKERYPDAILFFRLGDFYETFDEDAHVASRELDIVLTSRSMGKDVKAPMAGIPFHAAESYLARLIKKGYKVALCEQLSDPATSKGLVDRNVVRVVTPGTVIEPSILEQTANNYLAALVVRGEEAGLAHVDVSTGLFSTTQLPLSKLAPEVARLGPSEVLAPQGQEGLAGELNVQVVTPFNSRAFEPMHAEEMLKDKFGVMSLEAFGCENLPLATGAVGAILEYLDQTQPGALGQVTSLSVYSVGDYMALDAQTVRNLELFQSGRWGESELSLLKVLDFTKTPMGARLLRRWVGQPLLNLEALLRRQEGVAYFCGDMMRREETRNMLGKVSDIERILGRMRLEKASPRDLLALKESLRASGRLREMIRDNPPRTTPTPHLNLPPQGGKRPEGSRGGVGSQMSPGQQGFTPQPAFSPTRGEGVKFVGAALRNFPEVAGLVEAAVEAEPVGMPGEGRVIRRGFSEELDRLRDASGNAREFIAGLERKEREATGIKSLKVGYNRVFGYYIEVSKANLSQAPARYERRQTITNGERYVTPELKEYESLILNAQERIETLERDIWRQVCGQVLEQSAGLMELAASLAETDGVASLAEAASRYGYVRPELTLEGSIDIKAGRHPMVERVLAAGTFVPNDLYMANDDAQLLMITGPNMSGKSTFIRQAALITLMAQIGSFVPAERAKIGMADRIFTRVGLQDDLSTGQSTFMVEMVETAAILNQATPRSLVILDEIGRGTSTYDGLSIARAVAEHIHNSPRLGCRTLFATHYHELTELAHHGGLPRVRNFSVSVAEEGGRLVFLHRIVPGGADRSYGVHVAQLAGLPRSVVQRAWEVLGELEAGSMVNNGVATKKRGKGTPAQQMGLFGSGDGGVSEELRGLDVSAMTPLEAINKLFELQKRAREEG
ncbi:MAG: DNA mismatch repair protein MutS [SAR202 cluster bacterium]|nr:DNA mismatch repair protein MutS [SAR202 cluster bacterium]